MKRRSVSGVLASTALVASLAVSVPVAPVTAQGPAARGDLYAPLPQAGETDNSCRRRPDGQLPLCLINDGVFAGQLRPVAATPTSDRAGATSTLGSPLLALAALLLAGLVAAAVARRGGGPGRSCAAVVALLAVVFVSSGAAPQQARAQVPDGFFGVVAEDVFAGSSSYQRATLGLQRRTGVTLLRQTFSWPEMEPRRGQFQFTRTDRFVLAAARAGIQVMPLLFGEPAWATSRPRNNRSRPTYPPRRMSDFGAFASGVAKQYGPGGRLWAEHPDVVPRPVREYQVWNEPSLPAYWGGRPDAARYAAMLTAVHGALESAQPDAEVVTAGLPESRKGISLRRFITALYAAGAGPSIDVVGVNPYAGSKSGVLRNVRAARAAIPADVRGQTPIWITEIGWASGGPFARGKTFTPTYHATLIKTAIGELVARRDALLLRGIVYFAWRDGRPYAGGKDFWGLHTGLLTLNGGRKPALAAFAQVARSAE